MTDTYDEQLLLGYVEDELGPEDRARVERMVETDARLGRLLEDMRCDRDRLRRLPEPPTPTWLMDEAIDRLERTMLLEPTPTEAEARVNHQRGVLRRIGVGAAVAAMLLLCTYLVIDSLVHMPDSDLLVFDAHPRHQDPALTPGATDDPSYRGKGGPMIAKARAQGATPDSQIDGATRQVQVDEQVPVQGKPGPAPDQIDSQPIIAKGGQSGEHVYPGKGGPNIAQQQQRIVSRAGTQDAIAQVGKAGPSAPGLQAEQIPVEDPQPLDLDTLTHNNAQLSPEDIEALEVVVNTNDVTLTDDQLNRATLNVRQGNLVGPLTSNNGQQRVDLVAAQNMTQVTYNVEIPADQFNRWVREVQQVEPKKQVRARQDVLFQRRPQPLNLARTWPRRHPDYNAILTEQLPMPAARQQERRNTQQADDTQTPQAQPANEQIVTIPVYVNNGKVQAAPDNPAANQAMQVQQADQAEPQQPPQDAAPQTAQ